MSEWDKFLEKQLQDPEVRAEWDALEPEFAVIQTVIDAKKRAAGCRPYETLKFMINLVYTRKRLYMIIYRRSNL